MTVFMKSLPPESWTTTRTGSFFFDPFPLAWPLVAILSNSSCRPLAQEGADWSRTSRSGELVLAGRDGQAQQPADSLLAAGAVLAAEEQVAILGGHVHQRRPGLRLNLQRPDQIEDGVDELLGAERPVELF